MKEKSAKLSDLSKRECISKEEEEKKNRFSNSYYVTKCNNVQLHKDATKLPIRNNKESAVRKAASFLQMDALQ